MPNLTADTIEAAIRGLEFEQQRVATALADLRGLGRAEKAPVESVASAKRHLSDATRKKMAKAQQERWAKAKEEEKTPEVPRPKRVISPAGRRKIIEATRKRWAVYRAQKTKAAKTMAAGA